MKHRRARSLRLTRQNLAFETDYRAEKICLLLKVYICKKQRAKNKIGCLRLLTDALNIKYGFELTRMS